MLGECTFWAWEWKGYPRTTPRIGRKVWAAIRGWPGSQSSARLSDRASWPRSKMAVCCLRRGNFQWLCRRSLVSRRHIRTFSAFPNRSRGLMTQGAVVVGLGCGAAVAWKFLKPTAVERRVSCESNPSVSQLDRKPDKTVPVRHHMCIDTNFTLWRIGPFQMWRHNLSLGWRTGSSDGKDVFLMLKNP